LKKLVGKKSYFEMKKIIELLAKDGAKCHLACHMTKFSFPIA
jgi:hypothetical protein